MYNLLISRFKSALTDRNVELKLIIIFSIILLISFCVITINAVIWQIWFLYAVSIVFVLVTCLISAHCILFTATKKKLNYRFKDFFRFKTVWKNAGRAQEQDSIILLPLLKEIGIDTMSKVQEAIRHFQLLLSVKQKKGLEIVPIVSVALSISIAICGVVKTSLILFIAYLFSAMILTIIMCLAVKCIYKGIYYSLSEYALCERIEMALSEIYMKELIMK